jgi:hypothetical protein
VDITTDLQSLKPVDEVINLVGPILYSPGSRAWNTIRIKKDIIFKFPQLKERRAKFFYKMILHKNYKELEKALRKMKKCKDAVPMLFCLYKEKEKFPN